MKLIAHAAVALLACGLVAQSGKPPASPATAAYEKIVAEWKATTDAYSAAVKALTNSDEYKKAIEDKDRDALNKLRSTVPMPDAKPLAERCLETAATFDGDDRVQFYAWALQNGAKDVAAKAAESLLADHVKSPKLLSVVESGSMLLRSLGQEGGQAFLAKIAEENPNAEIRAYALFWPAYMASRDKNASDEAKEAAAAKIAEARTLAEGTMLADRIDAPKFIEERLQIGMEAPDIVGEDVDGVPFKLSDYRGKVVVIDFWGFW
ncbi:MAG: redoxin domain-containing protein [Planctomycetes bacterium]|nr:redoxin domain-containing protein [Planctomycetota bacterium]